MKISEIIGLDCIVIDLSVSSKSGLIRELARLAAQRIGMDDTVILSALLKREDLGSTGIGNGVAIPHANVANLAAPFSLFVRLKQPIEFDSVDERPVDLVFVTLVPANQASSHLNLLACIAREARSSTWLDALRSAKSQEVVHDLFSGNAG